jgi:hypothetical protein
VAVDLPYGRSDLDVRKGETQASVEVDAGAQAGPAISDVDATECAFAALGCPIAGKC